jgi:PAS domain S-box-containing protein
LVRRGTENSGTRTWPKNANKGGSALHHLIDLSRTDEPSSSFGENLPLEDFYEIFKNSFDGIFVTDRDGRALMVNAGCERNYDLPATEMIGKHVSELEAQGFIRPVIATRVIETRQRVTAIQKTHKDKTIVATGIPLFDERGQVRRVIINSRDTTQLELLQEELANTRNVLARVETEVAILRRDRLKFEGIVIQSEAMQGILDLAVRVAKSDVTVQLLGESGVGKEIIARLIHRESLRSKAPFIKINCGAIPRELMEAELFGYESGAFTGASHKGKPGLVELAHHGTLFLDEVGELPLDMQVKLLHLLQDRILTRVGGTRSFNIDIRVIAATNRDLEHLVNENLFRADLYYRLNVVPLTIPPLRDRRDDILALLQQSLAEFNKRYTSNRSFAPSVVKHLIDYSWPGNVRELRNIVERLVVTARSDTIGLDDLPQGFLRSPIARTFKHSLKEQLRSRELALIAEAVKKLGSTRAAAAELKLSQSSVVRKLARAANTD